MKTAIFIIVKRQFPWLHPNKGLLPRLIVLVYLFSFLETSRKFVIAELSTRKLGSSSVLIIRKLCNNKFTWCFHKDKQVYYVHHANVQGTDRSSVHIIHWVG